MSYTINEGCNHSHVAVEPLPAYAAALLPAPNFLTRRWPRLVRTPQHRCKKCGERLTHLDVRHYR